MPCCGALPFFSPRDTTALPLKPYKNLPQPGPVQFRSTHSCSVH
jgi:hypothetical protein